jgi:hypothetical protein
LVGDKLLCDLYRPKTEVTAIADLDRVVHIIAPSVVAPI